MKGSFLISQTYQSRGSGFIYSIDLFTYLLCFQEEKVEHLHECNAQNCPVGSCNVKSKETDGDDVKNAQNKEKLYSTTELNGNVRSFSLFLLWVT